MRPLAQHGIDLHDRRALGKAETVKLQSPTHIQFVGWTERKGAGFGGIFVNGLRQSVVSSGEQSSTTFDRRQKRSIRLTIAGYNVNAFCHLGEGPALAKVIRDRCPESFSTG